MTQDLGEINGAPVALFMGVSGLENRRLTLGNKPGGGVTFGLVLSSRWLVQASLRGERQRIGEELNSPLRYNISVP